MVNQTTSSDRLNNIIFEGKLLELPSEAPRCGDIKVAVVYKFKVERLVRGKSRNKTITLLIPCPDFMGDGYFEVNAVYLIEASANLEEAGSYTIYNDYPKRVSYWAIDISKSSGRI
jgi:hypothetical protein